MGFGLTAATIIGASTAFIVRRRISRKWIDYRSTPHDLTGKVIVLTGGNTGLGYEAAMDFAQRHATILIACRNMTKGTAAAKKIIQETGNINVECRELDLASLASVRTFAKTIQSNPKYASIHALICNAGVWVPPVSTGLEEEEEDETNCRHRKYQSEDGLEIHFGTNHLGHYLLTKCLISNLENSGDGRIIFVSSTLLKSGKLDFEAYDQVYQARTSTTAINVASQSTESGSQSEISSPHRKKKDGFAPPAYCDSKLMNALTCQQLATIPGALPSCVTVYAVSPGFCRSSLGRHVDFSFAKKMLIAPILLLIQRTARQGAQNIVFCVCESNEKLENGKLYQDGAVLKDENEYVHSFMGTMAAQTLWEVSENLCNEL